MFAVPGMSSWMSISDAPAVVTEVPPFSGFLPGEPVLLLELEPFR